jgi:hypothetical protein
MSFYCFVQVFVELSLSRRRHAFLSCLLIITIFLSPIINIWYLRNDEIYTRKYYTRNKEDFKQPNDINEQEHYLTNSIILGTVAPQIQDHVFCGGCFLAEVDQKNISSTSKTCGHHIRERVFESLLSLPSSLNILEKRDSLKENKTHTKSLLIFIQQMKSSNYTMYRQIMQDAAYKTSVEFPISCFRCNPKSCANENIYHRYDTLAPKIQNSWTHYMKTIRNENRFPISGMDNLDEFFSNEVNRKRNYLFEYNPSIVLLPEQEKRSFKHPNKDGSVAAVYLASFRVSNMFWCFDMKYHRKLVHHNNQTNWLGLAYLDADFGILAEGVFDLGGVDFRLYTLPAPNGGQQIYLTDACQSKLSLKPANDSIKKYPLFNKTTSGEIISAIYLRSTSCRTISNGKIAGKNIAYFDDPTITTETFSKNNVTIADGNHNNLVVVAENWPPQDDGTHKLSFTVLSNRRSVVWGIFVVKYKTMGT